MVANAAVPGGDGPVQVVEDERGRGRGGLPDDGEAGAGDAVAADVCGVADDAGGAIRRVLPPGIVTGPTVLFGTPPAA